MRRITKPKPTLSKHNSISFQFTLRGSEIMFRKRIKTLNNPIRNVTEVMRQDI